MKDKIQAYDVFMDMRAYKDMLPKLRDELEALEDTERAAWEAYEDEALPKSEWKAYEVIAEQATKSRKNMAEKIDCIENIIKLMRDLNEELEFLEECR